MVRARELHRRHAREPRRLERLLRRAHLRLCLAHRCARRDARVRRECALVGERDRAGELGDHRRIITNGRGELQRSRERQVEQLLESQVGRGARAARLDHERLLVVACDPRTQQIELGGRADLACDLRLRERALGEHERAVGDREELVGGDRVEVGLRGVEHRLSLGRCVRDVGRRARGIGAGALRGKAPRRVQILRRAQRDGEGVWRGEDPREWRVLEASARRRRGVGRSGEAFGDRLELVLDGALIAGAAVHLRESLRVDLCLLTACARDASAGDRDALALAFGDAERVGE